MKRLLLPFLLVVIFSSCVTKKKYTSLKALNESFLKKAEGCETDLAKKTSELETSKNKITSLEDQLEHLKKTNTNLLDRMADLSIISKNESENIRKSLDAINDQNKQINDLSSSIRQKDSLNLALVLNLKRSLADVNDDDINIEVKKGVVYVSLSDKMLFASGSYKINQKAESVLGKIASVANDHKELDLLVEGHTDNVPISTDCIEDNWDLSTKRAAAVVRLLQNKYKVAPQRLTAGGRSEYVNKVSNENASGKSINRRTEIIILPKLDQFFQLSEPPMK